MNVRMRGEQGVPFIISHRTVTQEPKVNRRWKYVGIKAGIKALASRVAAIVHESFWEAENEILEAGQSSIVNYAIQVIDDPGSDGPELVVTRIDGESRPGCGFYCEVINRAEPEKVMAPPTHPDSKAKAVGVRPTRNSPPQSIIRNMRDPAAEEPPPDDLDLGDDPCAPVRA